MDAAIILTTSQALEVDNSTGYQVGAFIALIVFVNLVYKTTRTVIPVHRDQPPGANKLEVLYFLNASVQHSV
jgi:hypothetical protein